VPKLITIRGPTRGREFEFDEVCILGRSPNCQIYIGDLTVSRQHARIVRQGHQWMVEDLSSGNGTFVNETRITQSMLQNDDEVRISNCVYRFSCEESAVRWVNMMTVVADNEPGLINTVTEARLPLASISAEHHLDDDRDTLRADLNRLRRMLETLYAVTNAIGSILEPKLLFNQILDYLFNVFSEADRGYIMVLDANGQLVPGAIRRRRGEGQGAGLTISQSVVAQVLQEGKSVLSTASPHQTFAGTAKMCAPLAAQGKILGILLIEGRIESRPFTQEDLDLLSGIALQAGFALLNAQMHQAMLRQQRLEQDLQFAKRVQQSFLPSEPPVVSFFHFTRTYHPVYDVGGDFYDFIPLPGERIGVLIGDVSGKGVSAALLMARLTSDIRYYAISEDSPARVLARANASLISTGQDNMFATVLYLVLDVQRRVMTVSNAGHIPPQVRRGIDGSVVEIDEATGLALGVLPDTLFEEIAVGIDPYDTVLLCTDGVVEAKSPVSEEYGLPRLQRSMSHAPVDAVLDTVVKDLQHHTGVTSQYDDITMVAFTRVD
jgi:phosphoserine phosphatase RsbU/P